MALNEAKKAVEELTDKEWDTFLSWALNDHRDYRINRPVIEKAQAAVVVELVDTGKVSGAQYITYDQAMSGKKPPAWANPGTDLTKMYPAGAVVERRERIWLNEVGDRLNSWEPGGDGVYENIWRDITDEVRAATTPQAEPEAEVPDESVEADGSAEHPWPFEVGRTATKGQYITYEGKLYRMAQNHTMVDHYRPGPGLESIFEPV